MPEGAAELAVRDRLKACGLLQRDGFTDRLVLHGAKVMRADRACRALCPRLLEIIGPQQAADVICAKGATGHEMLLVKRKARQSGRASCCCRDVIYFGFFWFGKVWNSM